MNSADDQPDEVTDHHVAESTAERLFDDEAGPMVRPYVIARGRLEPVTGQFDLITLVLSSLTIEAIDTEVKAGRGFGLAPEHMEILRLCQEPLSVVEIAERIGKPSRPWQEQLSDAQPGEFLDLLAQADADTEAADRYIRSVTEVDRHPQWPIQTVAVLLGDLLDKGLITTQDPDPDLGKRGRNLYTTVLEALHEL